MNIIGGIIVSLLWGTISAQLFLQSWLAFIGAIINIVGIVKGKVERKTTLLGLGVSFVTMLLFSGLLYLGDYLLTNVLSFGYTKIENIVYWVFVVIRLLFFIPQFPSKIRKSWRNANIAGSLEEDIWKRKLKKLDK